MRALVRQAMLAMAAMALASPVSAGEKPEVEVCFVLAEPFYKLQFGGKTAELQDRAVELLAGKLAREVAFFNPKPLSSQDCQAVDPQSWRLSVQFDRTDPGASGATHGVGFHLTFQGPGTDEGRTVYWPFRVAGKERQFTAEIEAFLRELDEALDKRKSGQLVADLMVQLPVATEATLHKDPVFGPAWEVTSHTHQDLCLSEKSELVVISRLNSGGSVTVREIFATVTRPGGQTWWAENIRGEVAASEKNKAPIVRALNDLPEGHVEAVAIHIEKYVLLRQCGGLSPKSSGL